MIARRNQIRIKFQRSIKKFGSNDRGNTKKNDAPFQRRDLYESRKNYHEDSDEYVKPKIELRPEGKGNSGKSPGNAFY